MAWEWTAWFDRHAGALAAIAGLGTLAFTAVLVFVTRRQVKIAERQAAVSERQADIAMKQVDLQTAIHRKEGPILVLHFSGFQSQPHDPKNEMLWFMVGIGNEGRRDVRVTHLEIEVLDPKGDGYSTYALHSREGIKHGKDPRGYYAPFFGLWDLEKMEAGGVIKSHEGESFYVALPANGGYDKWKRVRLRVSGIGVEPASKEIEWNLYWLRGAS